MTDLYSANLSADLSESEHRQKLLADALVGVLRSIGVIGEDSCPTGPELLAIADDVKNSNSFKELQELHKEVEYFLNNLDGAIRVREGGGPENLAKSFAVNIVILQKLLHTFHTTHLEMNSRLKEIIARM